MTKVSSKWRLFLSVEVQCDIATQITGIPTFYSTACSGRSHLKAMHYWSFVRRIHPVGFQRSSNAESVSISLCHHVHVFRIWYGLCPCRICMMTSSNENIFRVTGPCTGNSPVTGEFPSQRPVTRSFVFFFDLRLTKRLSKQSRRRWFETLSRSLWRHCNGLNHSHIIEQVRMIQPKQNNNSNNNNKNNNKQQQQQQQQQPRKCFIGYTLSMKWGRDY